MVWKRVRWIAGGVLLVLGLFDVPDQLQKVRDAISVAAEWVSQHGLDQNGWRWALVIVGALLAFGPEAIDRGRDFIGKRRGQSKKMAMTTTEPISKYLPAWALPSVTPSLPPRVFVGDGVTPKYLIDLYNTGKTTIQKEANVANFIGKWMSVTGTVSDINSNPPGLEFAEFKGPILTMLDMWFDDDWKDRIAVLAHDAKARVEGQIDMVNGISVRLRHCLVVPLTQDVP